MNIGYIVKLNWYPPQSGAAAHAYQVANQLTKKGHAVKTIAYWHEAPDFLEVYRRRELIKFLRDIDVLYIRIHGNWSVEHWTLLKALKFFKLPVIWEINAPLEELTARGMSSEKQIRSMNAKRRVLGKMVDAGICVSSVMKDYAENYLGIKNSFLIPNGSDAELFHPEKADDGVYEGLSGQFKVLWSGSSMYGWQGTEIIAKVAQKISTLDDTIKFILITDKEKLKQRDEFGKNVVIMDGKPYLELAPFIASADVGLCLYHPHGWNGRFYFSPLKLFDYMASGLPVIATNIGQISEVIQDGLNGLLTDNGIENIAEKIIYLKNNQAIGKQLGVKAREEVQRYYNWERVADETENIMKSLV